MAQLAAIEKKIGNGRRLTDSEALWLYEHADIHDLGRLASRVRERKNGNRATYVVNRFINYSNICVLNCKFCSFARRKRDADAFEFTVSEMAELAKKSAADGVTEVHIVGGLHPSLPFEYYTGLLRALKHAAPALTVKAFSAVEIRHLAGRVAKKSIRETLTLLRDAGLEALTGGGAEIFDPAVRDQICGVKDSADEWLEVHREWHRMGRRSTCTMLYGHIETPAQRIGHLRRLRELQDQTGGFTAFIPYVFEPANNALAHLRRISALEELRTLAVSRVYLDNFDHLTAYWISMGLPLAAVSLDYGVDDLHGTVIEEKVFHMAGAKTPLALTVMSLEKVIREAGREPVQRNTIYRSLRG
ncbi:MAG: aminofutalosine synthase MqnE [Verrucomicrobiales bacterium]|jgi:aminodeoxyfutalosine synthase|nr:aminofutalosine synthase MqnE [Verrucomicrobiales bacterium]